MNKDKPQNGPTFTLIPNKALDALLEKQHSHADILVYQVLCRHINKGSLQCWPSLETIGELAGLHRTNASKSINNLCATGMILKNKTRNSKSVYDNNTYYLPHFIDFQIETLLSQEKTSANKKTLHQLKALKIEIQEAINRQMSSSVTLLRSSVKQSRSSKKQQGSSETKDEVVAQNITNNTTNITINSTKNVAAEKVDETSDLTKLKRYDFKASKGDLSTNDTLLKIKREGLVQQMMQELDDQKSENYFRSIVSKLEGYEELIHKCLSLTRETQEITGIKTSRGAVFTDHIKREAQKIKIEL